MKARFYLTIFFGMFFFSIKVYAQIDTLHVMSYNVLYYGDQPACQGAHSIYHNYLKSIVSYANSDIIGLEKVAAIPMYPGDLSGTAPAGYADSILQYALNAAFPGRYAYCTYSNVSGADNMSILFYNQQKLGFISVVSSYHNTTDFNTYKLYYKSVDLASTHDTIFLYVTLNHTQSGSSASDITNRTVQIAGELANLQLQFSKWPNMINMGDFNVHNSSEGSYQKLVNPADSNFVFYDPPFYPDGNFTYPADWDNFPSSFSSFLTTSTRKSLSNPNSCGTDGGAKSWYDHIFISSSIAHRTAGIYYIPHSFKVLGNDGNRVGVSVNSSPTNTSAPSNVITALFQMSNKYPIIADFEVSPVFPATVQSNAKLDSTICVVNPVTQNLVLRFPSIYWKRTIGLTCYDLLGQCILKQNLFVDGPNAQLDFNVPEGIYFLRCTDENALLQCMPILKK